MENKLMQYISFKISQYLLLIESKKEKLNHKYDYFLKRREKI